MTEQPQCPKCGTPLPSHAPAGLCPQCLIRAGLESELQPQSSPAATIPSPANSRFEPLSVESLAGKFPQLEILELLGKGGMGAVYKARQRGLDRLVAVKVLPPEIGHDPAFAERFTREARALARLSHNHIVSVFDFGQSDGLFYIVMEYVDGVNLRQTIQTGKLTPAKALAIVPQICEALQFAHDEGIVHRDIKPENILIDKRGRVKIADFGLAKLLGQDAGDHMLTATHQVMGTLRYMAPEQMQGSREVDHRADIYSLGVIFYELLTGELPMGKFAPPSKRVQIDVRLDEIVLRALEQEPEQRYQHASEVKTDVEQIARSGVLDSPRPQSIVVASSSLASRLTWAASILVCLVGIVSSIMGNVPWLEVRDVDGGGVVTWHAFDLKEAMLAACGFLACGVSLLVLSDKGQAPVWRAASQIGAALLVIAAIIVFLTVSRAEFASPEGTRAINFAFTEHGEEYDMRNSYPPKVVGPVGPHFTLGWGVVLLFLGAWHLRTALSQRVELSSQSRQPESLSLPESAKDAATGPHLVQAPADCLLLVAGVAFATACGVAIWLLVVPQYSSDQHVNSLVRGGLTTASGVHAFYAVFIGVAGLLLRQLRARLFVLLVVVVVGLLLPAVIALNVVMEFRNMPTWPVAIPLWLGVPVAMAVAATLFRDDVRRAFAAAAERRTSNRSPIAASEPRFSLLALIGILWAPLPILGYPAWHFAIRKYFDNLEAFKEIHPAVVVVAAIILALGATAFFGTTILGFVAIEKIKRSAGKLYGLRLAQADALLFPLLFLAAAAGLAGTMILQSPLRLSGLDQRIFASPLQDVLMFLIAVPIWFFPARALWRAVVGPRDALSIPRIPLVGTESLVGQGALVIALAAIAAHAWPWHWISPPNTGFRIISNFEDITAMQSLLALALAIAAALFAAAPSLTLPVKRIIRGAAVLGAVAALALQIQFFRSLGEFEPGGTVVRLTRSYPQMGIYATIALTALAILLFALRLFEERAKVEISV